MTFGYVTVDELFSNPVHTDVPRQVRRMVLLRMERQGPHSVKELLKKGYTRAEIDATPVTLPSEVTEAVARAELGHRIF